MRGRDIEVKKSNYWRDWCDGARKREEEKGNLVRRAWKDVRKPSATCDGCTSSKGARNVFRCTRVVEALAMK
jgi:hypothetical protein